MNGRRKNRAPTLAWLRRIGCRSSSMRRAGHILVLTLILLLGVGAPIQDLGSQEGIVYDAAMYGPDRPLAEVLAAHGLEKMGGFVPEPKIEVVKSEYRLLLYSGELLLKTYRIQLGSDPCHDRAMAGDGRTPVGIYRICGHHPTSRYYLGLFFDYPNLEDLPSAVESGVLSEADAARIRGAIESHACPPYNTGLGGPFLIHGQHPDLTSRLAAEQDGIQLRKGLEPGDLDPWELDSFYNWTLGCIGMTNPDIRELYEAIPNGTPVIIRSCRDSEGGREP